ncbi:MAG: hypothetical protein AAF488_07925 [Planctomycetota bacterium]
MFQSRLAQRVALTLSLAVFVSCSSQSERERTYVDLSELEVESLPPLTEDRESAVASETTVASDETTEAEAQTTEQPTDVAFEKNDASETIQPATFQTESTDLADHPLGDLLREIDRRLVERRRQPDGTPIVELNENPRDQLRQLERDLVALSFSEAHSAHRSLTHKAIDAIRDAQEAGVESKLLAAALLGRTGAYDERNLLLSEVYSQLFDASPESLTSVEMIVPKESVTEAVEATAPRNGEFHLDSVAFAAEISGLGDYTRRPTNKFLPGERILIYGEFVDFLETHERRDSGDVYTREFTATLKLLDGERGIKDYGVIIDGRSESDTTASRLNFWAECTLPSNAEAGEYLLVIEAYDHGGASGATATLDLKLSTDADKPMKKATKMPTAKKTSTGEPKTGWTD